MELAATRVAGSPPSAMRWCWPGAGARAASLGGGRSMVVTGAVREVAGRFGASAAARLEVGTSNLVPNPSFELDVAGWLAFGGGGAIARVSGGAASGAYSCEVTAAGTGDGAQSSAPFGGVSGATAYTMSVSITVPSGKTVTVQVNEYDGGGSYLGVAHTVSVSGMGAVQRASMTFTTHASCAYLALYAYSMSGAVTFEVDAWQVEPGSVATSYCDGSLGLGYTWSGAAHGSASTRATARLQAFAAESSVLCGSVALWWRPASAASGAGDRPLLRWGDATAHLDLRYRDSGDAFRLTSQVAGASADVVDSGAQTFAAGDDLLVVASWDERSLRLQVGESTPVVAARAGGVPVIAEPLIDLASDGAGVYAGDGLGPVLWFSRALTAHEVAVLARMSRAPGWQEVA
ncbi:MAG: carbohydrate binding domain-containing protein [Dehalococcoidia bacterium]